MSRKYESAGKIAVALRTSERSMNRAAADLFKVGAQVCEARINGATHPLEGQKHFEKLCDVIAEHCGAIGKLARVHDGLHAEARKQFDVTGTGGLCPFPEKDDDGPNGQLETIVPLHAAA